MNSTHVGHNLNILMLFISIFIWTLMKQRFRKDYEYILSGYVMLREIDREGISIVQV